MKKYSLLFCALLALLALPLLIRAQNPPAGQEGIEAGGYSIQQSIEVGYRHTDLAGNGADQEMFNTFLNLQTGPRLLDQTFSMRSLNHAGVLFDDLYVNSFGWGGDPNNAARVRIGKYKWYNFTADFRRDQNYFDYDIFANPLRVAPGSDAAAVALGYPNVNYSPHAFAVTRRMADVDLTLLPQSKFSVRLGYGRNRADGPAYSSHHEGADPELDMPWNTTYQTWRFGFDTKYIPNTTVSFDQFLQYGKNDTNNFLNSFGAYPLSTAVDGSNSVIFGLGAPASSCLTAAAKASNYSNCSGYTSYSLLQRVRTTTPTSQLSFVSRPLDKLELTGRASYSWTDMSSPFDQSLTGLVTRTHERALYSGGDIQGQIMAVSSDFGVTYHITDKLSISDTFLWLNNRQPALWNSTEGSVTIVTPTGGVNSFAQCNPLPTVTNAQCIVTPAGTPVDTISNFLGFDNKLNTVQVEYSFTSKIGGRIGYRYGTRNIREFAYEPAPAGFATWDLVEHTGLIGVWLRPSTKFRANGELEITSNGGSGVDSEGDLFSGPLTRLSPKNQQHYRVRSTYSPTKMLDLSTTVNMLENRNGNPGIQYLGHNRNLGFTASIHSGDKFWVDLSYNYNDYLQNAWMCFVDTYSPLPPGTTTWTLKTPTTGCPTYDAAANPTPNYLYTNYQDTAHYGSAIVNFHPVQRVTLQLGYGITRVDGTIPILNGFQPLGPLAYTYHQPLGQISVEMAKNWTWNAYWNYDQYGEDSFTGATFPRYFHDNRTMVGVKYAF